MHLFSSPRIESSTKVCRQQIRLIDHFFRLSRNLRIETAIREKGVDERSNDIKRKEYTFLLLLLLLILASLVFVNS